MIQTKLELKKDKLRDNTLFKWIRSRGLIVLIYLFAILLTDAFFMGDTADYVSSVITGVEFWEFGHLLWRPLGWSLFQIFHPITEKLVGANPHLEITLLFVIVNWIAGLLSVLFLQGFLRRLVKQEWVVTITVIAFIFAQAFLNYSQSGSSYVPGLAMLLLGFYLMTTDEENFTWKQALIAGLALSLAFCFWGIYLWGIPAALASPIILYGLNRRTVQFVLQASSFVAVFTGLIYFAVIIHLGIHDLSGVLAWVTASSQLMKVTSLSRVVFGIPRSILNLGNDGILFKRFLLKDAYNPVTILDLVQQSLWKLALFYAAIFSVLIGLIRSKMGRRVIVLFAVNTVSIGLFAMFVDGAAVERYFPLYPTLFLAMAFALIQPNAMKWSKALVLVFFVVIVTTNYRAMSKSHLNAIQENAVARVKEALPPINSSTIFFTVNQQDDLVNFSRSFPFHSLNQTGGLKVRPLLFLNTRQVEGWRKEFAQGAFESWQEGGEVWISKRALAMRPLSEWKWVEGDDRRVSWQDVYDLVSQVEINTSIGGEDGFVLLLKTSKSEAVLKQLLESRDGKSQNDSQVVP
jgi:hypothetical protein